MRGGSGMGHGARKVIKKPQRLPHRRSMNVGKQRKMNVSRLGTVQPVRYDQILSQPKAIHPEKYRIAHQ